MSTDARVWKDLETVTDHRNNIWISIHICTELNAECSSTSYPAGVGKEPGYEVECSY